MEYSIKKASLSDIQAIRSMADVVFRVTYANIITPDQMEFMLDWMYSPDSLEKQIEGEGKAFFIASSGDVNCGYVSVEFERELEDGRPLFHLQKIYVMPEFQHKGLGTALFNHVVEFLRSRTSDGFRLELNVNRNNSAVRFYEAMGMVCDRQGDFPIGNGFYMNDFIYALDA